MAPLSLVLNTIPPTLHYPLRLLAFLTTTTYLLSLLTANVSQVDRIWTFAPPLYSLYFLAMPVLLRWGWCEPWAVLGPYVPKEAGARGLVGGEVSERAGVMVGVMLVWMARLTYNTYRRGLFNLHDEDYRWAIFRARVPPWLFHIFNLTFIALTQNVLLLLLSLPTHRASLRSQSPLTPTDYVLAATALGMVLIELAADNQQWAYQEFKRRPLTEAQDAPTPLGVGTFGVRGIRWTQADRERGFVSRGLWAYSRHPNFAAEQTFWGIITLLPLLSPTHSTPPTPPATLIDLSPSLALCALFFFSTRFTEEITEGKYGQRYGEYRRRVGMFVPWGVEAWLGLGGRGGGKKVE